MENLQTFMKSGILESYVLGNSTQEEMDFVEQMAVNFNEVRIEIESISKLMEFYALSHSVAPDPIIKPFLLATIDFTERMKHGEAASFPPELNSESKISDFSEWLERVDMILPPYFNDIHAKIIAYTPKAITAIVWVKDIAPQEVHDHEYEKFLIVEGTCNITVGDEVYTFSPGDYFSIPLHKNHHVVVTSSIPCKVILQRIAA